MCRPRRCIVHQSEHALQASWRRGGARLVGATDFAALPRWRAPSSPWQLLHDLGKRTGPSRHAGGRAEEAHTRLPWASPEDAERVLPRASHLVMSDTAQRSVGRWIALSPLIRTA